MEDTPEKFVNLGILFILSHSCLQKVQKPFMGRNNLMIHNCGNTVSTIHYIKRLTNRAPSSVLSGIITFNHYWSIKAFLSNLTPV
jgi:hypothetical protein